jgi:hypothetical protein
MKKSIGGFLLLLSAITMFSFIGPGCKSKPKDADIKASVESALQAGLVSVADRLLLDQRVEVSCCFRVVGNTDRIEDAADQV